MLRRLQGILLVMTCVSGCKPAVVKTPEPVLSHQSGDGEGTQPLNIAKEVNLWENYTKYSLNEISAADVRVEGIMVDGQSVAFIKAPIMDIDFLKIKICNTASKECNSQKTNQPHTFLTSLKPGDWSISVRACIHPERSENGEQLCSEPGEAVPYTQPLPNGSGFSALLQEMEFVNKSYMELGYLLFKELKEFETLAGQCKDADQHFLAKVRSFTLGGPDVLHNELRDLPEIKLKSGLLLTKGDEPVENPENKLGDLQKELEAMENQITESRNAILASEGFTSLKGQIKLLKSQPGTTYDTFKELFHSEAKYLSENLLQKVSETARITSGLVKARESYLQEAIDVAEDFSSVMDISQTPDSEASASLASFIETIKNARKNLTKDNWNKYGGYFELSWKEAREYLLNQIFEKAEKSLLLYHSDHQQFVSLSNFLQAKSELQGNI